MLDLAVGVILVALATSLGWGMRGEWGHWWGATVPGALCGMTLWLSYGEAQDVWQMVVLAAVMAASISLGGVLSYGKIVGYVKEQHDRSPAFGLFGLFLVGGLWGFFAGVGLGLATSGLCYGVGDLALWGTIAFTGAYLANKLLVLGLDLHLSPPRHDAWAPVLGAAVSTAAYLALLKGDISALVTALVGWVGFGGGFCIGALIHRWCVSAGLWLDSWKFMEHSVGFWGGLSLAAVVALRGGSIAPLPVGDATRLASAMLVFFLVPYMNLTNTAQYWFSEAKFITRKTFAVIQVICLVLFAASALAFLSFSRSLRSVEGGPVIFSLYSGLLIVLAVAKFRFSTARQRLAIDATFVGHLVICLLLLTFL